MNIVPQSNNFQIGEILTVDHLAGVRSWNVAVTLNILEHNIQLTTEYELRLQI